jgi:hypothetical protein
MNADFWVLFIPTKGGAERRNLLEDSAISPPRNDNSVEENPSRPMKGGPVFAALVLFLGLMVWSLSYLNVRSAYRLPKGWRKTVIQLSLVFAAAAGFVGQVNLLERSTSDGFRGPKFFLFVLIECGGGLALMFFTGLRERAKIRRLSSGQPHTL